VQRAARCWTWDRVAADTDAVYRRLVPAGALTDLTPAVGSWDEVVG
jgi:hypothetical protein